MGENLLDEKIRIDLSPIKKAKNVLKELEALGVVQDHITGDTIIPRDSFAVEKQDLTNVLELEVPGGHGFMFDLWRDEEDKISVTKVFFSEGSVIEIHKHSVIELFVIYKGSAEICIFDKNDALIEGPRIIGEFDSRRLEPGVKHSVKFLEDTWHLLVTMPAYNLETDLP
jgi:quercetin dioxygenase-like cupin family protein